MCVFDVDKIKTGFLCNDRSFDKVLNDIFDFFIADHVCLRVAEFLIQQRMAVCGNGFQNIVPVRVRITAGVSQLQTDHEVVIGTELFLVDFTHIGADAFQGIGGMICHHQLTGIASAGMHHGGGFSSVKKFCTAAGEIHPASVSIFTGSTFAGTVPPFHGEDCPTVADGTVFVLDLLRESSFAPGGNVFRQTDGNIFAFEVFGEFPDRFEFDYFTIVLCHNQNRFPFFKCIRMISLSSNAS